MHNPLDLVSKLADEEQGTGLYQYFIKLVPTIYEAPDGARTNTNQYSYTERFRPLASSLTHTDHDHNKHTKRRKSSDWRRRWPTRWTRAAYQ